MAVVLVVDDDDPIRALVTRILQRDAHTVVTARHGAEAIGLLANRDFDLMVLDVMMPIANAFDVLAFMRDRGPWTQTIILTAAHDAQLTTLNTENVCAIVHKPFDIEALQTLVRSCVAPLS